MSKQSDLIVNNLLYTIPSRDTTAIERSFKRNYFDQRNYTAGQLARCVWQTGSQFVDCQSSSLVLRVELDDKSASAVSFGEGSVINFIESVRVYSSAGVELVNILNHNINQMLDDKQNEPKEWFDTQGVVCGYDPTVCGTGGARSNLVQGGSVEYIIPLSKVAPIFNNSSKALMPSVLASGLIVELQLATSAKALVRTGGTGNITAQIKDIYFNLNCTTLNDSTVATLNDNASKNLLKYSYIDTYTARLTQSPNNQIVSTSISKAVSFADKINAVEIEHFLMNSDSVDYQYTLGSIQLPSNVDTQGQKQAYIQSLATYGKLHETVDSVVQTPALRYQDWAATLNTKTCSFSKNAYLALSQLAINSSRTLRYEQKYAVAPAEARLIFVFLKFVKVLSCSITDVDVSM
jgi:hypothetical protein